MEWRFRPARDLGLPAGERLRSHAREPGLLSVLTHTAWRQLIRVYLRLFHRLSIAGAENLPAAPPFVLIANHTSHLDALVLASVLPRHLAHAVFALAAGEVFFSSLAASGFAAFAVNALPVWRKRTTERDLAFLRQRLEEDRLVYILFPEGTRSRSGAMAQFRPGIGALVAGGNVPVVPCCLAGTHAAWPPDRRLPHRGELRLLIGAPLLFHGASNDRAGWITVAATCEAAVRGLALQPLSPSALK
jgi:1-acyl-sn-glycerol-3-phosphate acyltransferase